MRVVDSIKALTRKGDDMATAIEESLDQYCERIARSAREASRELAAVSGKVRTDALEAAAEMLGDTEELAAILAANEKDLAAAPSFGLSNAQIDRLRLNQSRLAEMAVATAEIARMADPVGQVIEGSVRPNGLSIQKVRVPIGVVLFIYESRPNVTGDAAALCIKSGNAVILRGGKEAIHSNRALADLFRRALARAGAPENAVLMVETTDRAAVGKLLAMPDSIDLAIPRGGEELIRRVAREAAMPVLKHYKGVCHVYLERTADPRMAVEIVENSKCQRPGVCNAAETLLVDRAAAATLLPKVAERLRSRGCELRGCEETRGHVPWARPAAPEDYGREFLDLVLAVRVVAGVDEAAEHIARHGSGHTETIVTRDYAAARKFTQAVDSSAVLVNASTRFNDGGQFGLGAEIGISTDKFHARGPCGLLELTSYKYIVFGDGQIRG